MYLIGFPLLVLPFAFYNIIEFLMPGDRPGTLWLYGLKDVQLASGAVWTLTVRRSHDRDFGAAALRRTDQGDAAVVAAPSSIICCRRCSSSSC